MGLLLSASGASLLAASAETELETHTRKIITIEGLRFYDINANGRIDAYEDWRLPAQKRAADLVRRMTLAEKMGMMLIATHSSH